MRLKEYPIGDYVGKCQTWNPKSSGVGSFDYIDLSSVDKDTKSIASIEHCECSDAPSRARQLVETDDILVATVRPNLNGVALANGAHHGMTASTGYCVLRPDKDKLDSGFLFHWVKTRVFVQRMVDGATGANYPAVSDAKVKASKIPLPPLDEQKRIAGILDAADALLAKRREALAQLDTLIQSTFLDMFGDPVTNPMEWEVTTVDRIGSIQGGLQVTSKRRTLSIERPYLRVANVFRGFLELDELKTIRLTETEERRTSLEYEDILIVEGHGNKEEIGRCARWDGSIAQCVHQNHLIRVRCDRSKASPLYVEKYINSPGGRRSLTGTSRTTSGLNTISVSKVRRSEIQLPPLDLQHRFAAIVESVELQRAVQRAHLAELDTLFASLQSRAFRGDL